tara:strand:+ start:123 stop:1394 length:1272 start_codon:yes stop_codon:yes gene_type:complete
MGEMFGGKGSKGNKNGNSPSNGAGIFKENFESSFNTKIQIGKVTDIILNTQHPKYVEKGYWGSIGTIFYAANGENPSDEQFAKPYLSNISSFPLINEYVLLFNLPDIFNTTNKGKNLFYYLPAINLFNNPHINPLPTKSYNISLKGDNFGKETTLKSTPNYEFNSPLNPSQKTFIEQDELSTPLLPFAGDNIYQGRFGNAIRLGSTARPLIGKITSSNNWSKVGDNGSPITIISNGQNENGFNWVTENINKNDSSIYLTSTQTIPLEASIRRYNSYSVNEQTPTSPLSYQGKQIIINSGRLVFNSTDNHILLSSQKTISFGAQKGFNFDTPSNFVVDAGTSIKLGGKTASQPLIKGHELYDVLFNLITALSQTISIMALDTVWPGGNPVADIGKGQAADSTNEILKLLLEDLENIKSTKVFTL